MTKRTDLTELVPGVFIGAGTLIIGSGRNAITLPDTTSMRRELQARHDSGYGLTGYAPGDTVVESEETEGFGILIEGDLDDIEYLQFQVEGNT